MMTNQLIETFDLSREVDVFVQQRVAALLGGERHAFEFWGSLTPCGPDAPAHIPHAGGGYSTVANGWGSYFCPGREGDEIAIVVTSSGRGDPRTFAHVAGYWFASAPAEVVVV